jgi:hypothetical protein
MFRSVWRLYTIPEELTLRNEELVAHLQFTFDHVCNVEMLIEAPSESGSLVLALKLR